MVFSANNLPLGLQPLLDHRRRRLERQQQQGLWVWSICTASCNQAILPYVPMASSFFSTRSSNLVSHFCLLLLLLRTRLTCHESMIYYNDNVNCLSQQDHYLHLLPIAECLTWTAAAATRATTSSNPASNHRQVLVVSFSFSCFFFTVPSSSPFLVCDPSVSLFLSFHLCLSVSLSLLSLSKLERSNLSLFFSSRCLWQ